MKKENNTFVFWYLILLLILIDISEVKSADDFSKKKPQCAQSSIHFLCLLHCVPLSLDNICQIIPPKEQGESLLEISNALEYIGFETQGKELSFNELRNEKFPLIVHMKNNHFMVVEKIMEKNISIYDIDVKRQIWENSHFEKEWTGIALCVNVKDSTQRLPSFIKNKRNNPTIKFQKLFIDAGIIGEGQKEVVYTYPFENIGGKDLRIISVKTSCRCTAPNYTKEAILPGGSSEISVVYNVGSRIGPFGESCAVITNDPDFPVIELYLSGNTKKQLNYSPPIIDFVPVLYGNTIEYNAYIQYMGDSPLEFGEPFSDTQGIQASITSANKSDFTRRHQKSAIQYPHFLNDLTESYVVKVKYSPANNRYETLNGKLTIPTNLKRRPTIEIPLRIKSIATIKLTPSVLFLGKVRLGEKIRKEIIVSSQNNHDILVKSVDTKNTGLSYNIKKLNQNELRIKLNGEVTSTNIKELSDSNITLKVMQQGQEEVYQIPVVSYN